MKHVVVLLLIELNSGFTNCEDCGCTKTQNIKCEACNCKYNENLCCMADDVRINEKDASCQTFVQNNNIKLK